MTTPPGAWEPERSSLISLDGYLNDATVPADREGITRFQLLHSPSGENVDDLVMPCTVADCELAATLDDLAFGALLRITGRLQLPHHAGDRLVLRVSAIEVLETGGWPWHTPAGHDGEPAGRARLGRARLAGEEHTPVPRVERYRSYLLVLTPGGVTYVWHKTGVLVGTTDDPQATADLIAAFEYRSAKGDT
ncbi:hypothetical protein [Streptomyces sp. NPDC002758]